MSDYTITTNSSGTIGYWPYNAVITETTTMEAIITLQNKTSLSKEEFNAKIQKLITKLHTKFTVKDYDVTF